MAVEVDSPTLERCPTPPLLVGPLSATHRPWAPVARGTLPWLDASAALLCAVAVAGLGRAGVLHGLVAALAIVTYDDHKDESRVPTLSGRTVLRLALLAIVSSWFASLACEVALTTLPTAHMLLLTALTAAAWSLNRICLGLAAGPGSERVVVLGSGDVAGRLVDLLGRHTKGQLEVVGFLDQHPPAGRMAAGPPFLGTLERLSELVFRGDVDRVLVAFSTMRDRELLEILRACDESGVRVDVVPRFFELLGMRPYVYSLGGVAVMGVRGRTHQPFLRAIKRAFDVVVAGVMLAAVAPVMALVACAVKLDGPGPVLFRQRRVGYRGREFEILKFRSMVTDADALDREQILAVQAGDLAISAAVDAIKGSDARVTRVGAFIRKTSLDELPQLWNVVRGDMSLVGPRPLRAFEVEALEPWEQLRHCERPGITGLWQVSGRSGIAWDERMHMDYTYARHWSLGHDLEILARTVPAVLAREGAR